MNRAPEAGGPEVAQAAPTTDRRILLVDDEKAFARTLAKRIAMRGYPCDVAFDGATGLDMLVRGSYAVMLLDLRLPDLHGKTILLRARAARPGVAVVIVTAHGNDADEAECRALGAADFLNKPLDITQLIEIIARLSRPDAEPRPCSGEPAPFDEGNA